MKQTEDTIKTIKKSLAEMWILVEGQVAKAADALLTDNKELAHEVMSREKMVDSYELLIDRECENFFALLNPVAVDLRMMLSIIKINNNLERIGDFADSLAYAVASENIGKIAPELLEELKLKEMLDEVLAMLRLCKTALTQENSQLAGKVLLKDEKVDQFNAASTTILAAYMKRHPETITNNLYLHAAIRRIERIGDRCSNIAEDIVFYLEARVLKHIHNQETDK